jgi:CHAT domain-containing protein
MTEFYRNLKLVDKVPALREVQLRIRERWEHPFFWAALQLNGVAG